MGCDENLCQVKSDDAVVGMSSLDHVFDGDVVIVGVGTCEDTIILAATSVSVEPSSEEFSSMHMVVDMFSNDSTLVIDDEVSDVVIESCYTINQQSFDVHFMDNPMFKIFDQDSNPVYIMSVGTKMKTFLVGFSYGDNLTPTSLA